MLSAVLSVLLMGMVPPDVPSARPLAADLLSVSLPAPSDGSGQLAGLASSMTASGAIVVDLQSAQTLYAHGAATRRSVASLAKLMTAVLIVENHQLNEIVQVPAEAETLDGDRY